MEFIVHDEPVGRAERNYIAHADLAPFGLDGQLEQLWLRPLDGDLFAVACVPFRAYGLALGDQVRLSGDDRVSEVVTSSGHRVLRMLLMPRSDQAELHRVISDIQAEITAAGLLSEWSGDRHVAVDFPPRAQADQLFQIMEREVAEGRAFWEWAHVKPFTA
ncbi:DUF4265 domain-containing protein [Kitasatospora sp. RB6PN24]|uniref:DUF4265 domain-containing protein n=1 Tax=Kitasatospora humi TaxID=2893891 RepID=UPI001E45B4D2|nr:DUF4265 domain-containing protein [Kitasatospora humi]MCC9309313.1 DUF4265 domain-containing protein [Kitasatospora humi]